VPAKGRDTMGVTFAKPEKNDKILAVARNVERVIDVELGTDDTDDTADGTDPVTGEPDPDIAGSGDDLAAAEGVDELPNGGAPVQEPVNDPVGGAVDGVPSPEASDSEDEPGGDE
jgi:DNA gyrase subunit A